MSLGNGFAAGRGAHRAPNAVRGFAAGDRASVSVAAVDRFADETDGTVKHRRVDAARVVRLNGRDAPSPVGAVGADRGVRRENGVETADHDLTVGPTLTAPSVGRPGLREFGSAFQREARARAVAGAVERGETEDHIPFDLRAGASEGANAFGPSDGVRGAVGNGRHRRERADVEDAAVRGLRVGVAFVVRVAFVVPHAVAVAGHIVKTTGFVAVGRRLRRVAVGRAKERGDRRRERREIDGEVAAPRVDEARIAVGLRVRDDFGVDRVLFDVRQEENRRAERAAVTVGVVRAETDHRAGGREGVVGVVVVLDGQPELFQVVRALHTTGGFASGLDGREKQTNEDTDDRDNDQQFDEGETQVFAFRGHSRLQERGNA